MRFPSILNHKYTKSNQIFLKRCSKISSKRQKCTSVGPTIYAMRPSKFNFSSLKPPVYHNIQILFRQGKVTLYQLHNEIIFSQHRMHTGVAVPESFKALNLDTKPLYTCSLQVKFNQIHQPTLLYFDVYCTCTFCTFNTYTLQCK